MDAGWGEAVQKAKKRNSKPSGSEETESEETEFLEQLLANEHWANELKAAALPLLVERRHGKGLVDRYEEVGKNADHKEQKKPEKLAEALVSNKTFYRLWCAGATFRSTAWSCALRMAREGGGRLKETFSLPSADCEDIAEDEFRELQKQSLLLFEKREIKFLRERAEREESSELTLPWDSELQAGMTEVEEKAETKRLIESLTNPYRAESDDSSGSIKVVDDILDAREIVRRHTGLLKERLASHEALSTGDHKDDLEKARVFKNQEGDLVKGTPLELLTWETDVRPVLAHLIADHIKNRGRPTASEAQKALNETGAGDKKTRRKKREAFRKKQPVAPATATRDRGSSEASDAASADATALPSQIANEIIDEMIAEAINEALLINEIIDEMIAEAINEALLNEMIEKLLIKRLTGPGEDPASGGANQPMSEPNENPDQEAMGAKLGLLASMWKEGGAQSSLRQKLLAQVDSQLRAAHNKKEGERRRNRHWTSGPIGGLRRYWRFQLPPFVKGVSGPSVAVDDEDYSDVRPNALLFFDDCGLTDGKLGRIARQLVRTSVSHLVLSTNHISHHGIRYLRSALADRVGLSFSRKCWKAFYRLMKRLLQITMIVSWWWFGYSWHCSRPSVDESWRQLCLYEEDGPWGWWAFGSCMLLLVVHIFDFKLFMTKEASRWKRHVGGHALRPRLSKVELHASSQHPTRTALELTDLARQIEDNTLVASGPKAALVVSVSGETVPLPDGLLPGDLILGVLRRKLRWRREKREKGVRYRSVPVLKPEGGRRVDSVQGAWTQLAKIGKQIGGRERDDDTASRLLKRDKVLVARAGRFCAVHLRLHEYRHLHPRWWQLWSLVVGQLQRWGLLRPKDASSPLVLAPASAAIRVAAVAANGVAHGQLRAGDLLLAINGVPVGSVAATRKLLHSVSGSLTLLIGRYPTNEDTPVATPTMAPRTLEHRSVVLFKQDSSSKTGIKLEYAHAAARVVSITGHPNMKINDVVVSIDGEGVTGSEDATAKLNRAIARARDAGADEVPVLLLRKAGTEGPHRFMQLSLKLSRERGASGDVGLKFIPAPRTGVIAAAALPPAASYAPPVAQNVAAARVTRVFRDSPARGAVMPGDVILAVEGAKVTGGTQGAALMRRALQRRWLPLALPELWHAEDAEPEGQRAHGPRRFGKGGTEMPDDVATQMEQAQHPPRHAPVTILEKLKIKDTEVAELKVKVARLKVLFELAKMAAEQLRGSSAPDLAGCETVSDLLAKLKQGNKEALERALRRAETELQGLSQGQEATSKQTLEQVRISTAALKDAREEREKAEAKLRAHEAVREALKEEVACGVRIIRHERSLRTQTHLLESEKLDAKRLSDPAGAALNPFSLGALVEREGLLQKAHEGWRVHVDRNNLELLFGATKEGPWRSGGNFKVPVRWIDKAPHHPFILVYIIQSVAVERVGPKSTPHARAGGRVTLRPDPCYINLERATRRGMPIERENLAYLVFANPADATRAARRDAAMRPRARKLLLEEARARLPPSRYALEASTAAGGLSDSRLSLMIPGEGSWAHVSVPPHLRKGKRVEHPKRGPGVVAWHVAEQATVIFVKFDSGELHGYKSHSWGKLHKEGESKVSKEAKVPKETAAATEQSSSEASRIWRVVAAVRTKLSGKAVSVDPVLPQSEPTWEEVATRPSAARWLADTAPAHVKGAGYFVKGVGGSVKIKVKSCACFTLEEKTVASGPGQEEEADRAASTWRVALHSDCATTYLKSPADQGASNDASIKETRELPVNDTSVPFSVEVFAPTSKSWHGQLSAKAWSKAHQHSGTPIDVVIRLRMRGESHISGDDDEEKVPPVRRHKYCGAARQVLRHQPEKVSHILATVTWLPPTGATSRWVDVAHALESHPPSDDALLRALCEPEAMRNWLTDAGGPHARAEALAEAHSILAPRLAQLGIQWGRVAPALEAALPLERDETGRLLAKAWFEAVWLRRPEVARRLAVMRLRPSVPCAGLRPVLVRNLQLEAAAHATENAHRLRSRAKKTLQPLARANILSKPQFRLLPVKAQSKLKFEDTASEVSAARARESQWLSDRKLPVQAFDLPTSLTWCEAAAALEALEELTLDAEGNATAAAGSRLVQLIEKGGLSYRVRTLSDAEAAAAKAGAKETKVEQDEKDDAETAEAFLKAEARAREARVSSAAWERLGRTRPRASGLPLADRLRVRIELHPALAKTTRETFEETFEETFRKSAEDCRDGDVRWADVLTALETVAMVRLAVLSRQLAIRRARCRLRDLNKQSDAVTVRDRAPRLLLRLKAVFSAAVSKDKNEPFHAISHRSSSGWQLHVEDDDATWKEKDGTHGSCNDHVAYTHKAMAHAASHAAEGVAHAASHAAHDVAEAISHAAHETTHAIAQASHKALIGVTHNKMRKMDEAQAATTIGKVVRGRRVRKQMETEVLAATVVQKMVRGRRARKQMRERKQMATKALLTAIQSNDLDKLRHAIRNHGAAAKGSVTLQEAQTLCDRLSVVASLKWAQELARLKHENTALRTLVHDVIERLWARDAAEKGEAEKGEAMSRLFKLFWVHEPREHLFRPELLKEGKEGKKELEICRERLERTDRQRATDGREVCEAEGWALEGDDELAPLVVEQVLTDAHKLMCVDAKDSWVVLMRATDALLQTLCQANSAIKATRSACEHAAAEDNRTEKRTADTVAEATRKADEYAAALLRLEPGEGTTAGGMDGGNGGRAKAAVAARPVRVLAIRDGHYVALEVAAGGLAEVGVTLADANAGSTLGARTIHFGRHFGWAAVEQDEAAGERRRRRDKPVFRAYDVTVLPGQHGSHERAAWQERKVDWLGRKVKKGAAQTLADAQREYDRNEYMRVKSTAGALAPPMQPARSAAHAPRRAAKECSALIDPRHCSAQSMLRTS